MFSDPSGKRLTDGLMRIGVTSPSPPMTCSGPMQRELVGVNVCAVSGLISESFSSQLVFMVKDVPLTGISQALKREDKGRKGDYGRRQE